MKTQCPNCQKPFEISEELIGQYGRCDACNHKFQLVAIAETAEKVVKPQPSVAITGQNHQSAKKSGKKSGKAMAALLLLLLVAGGGFAFYKYGGMFSKENEVAENGSSGENTSNEPARGFLHNTNERSNFEASPVQVAHQWEYARIARTYPNDAGMYPLLSGNAKIVHAEQRPESAKASLTYNLASDRLMNWHYKGDKAVWELGEAVVTETYHIIVHYGAASQCVGNEFTVKVGSNEIKAKVKNTGGYGNIAPHQIGAVQLKKGERYTVTMASTIVKADTGLMDLEAIEIVPARTPHRWFDVVSGQWTRKIPQSLRYDKGKMCDPAPPVHLIKGAPKGYAVITTKAIRDKSKVLDKFLEHKRGFGYKTMVITEDDFGGGKGPDAFDNIRKWLHENYKKKEILYVLFIGNPNPSHGDIPMPPANTNVKEFREKIAAGEHPHAGRPSDSLYMDCSGSTPDLNGDGIYAGNGDYDAEKGGLDTVWDVLVGRIHYYGEDSAWGKVSDVDAILQKTMNYENASLDEILERYHFEIDGFTLDGHVVEWGGFPYVTREQPHRGRLTLDHFSWQNNSFMDQYNVGFIRSGGHASPTFIESGVNSGWLANRIAPRDTVNVVAEYGGCDCLQPEHPMNMGYMHLRKGAIAVAGASRSIAGVRGHGGRVRPSVFHSIRSTPLKRGISVGQAHWQGLAHGQRMPNGGAQMWTLYGDPSVVPFPQRLAPKRQHAVRPVHDLEHFEPMSVSSHAKRHEQEYDIQNLSGKELEWSVSTTSDWVNIVSPVKGKIADGEIVTIKVQLNEKARSLPAGRSVAQLTFNIGEKKEYRALEFIRTVPELTHKFNFEDKAEGAFNAKRDGNFKVFDRFCSDNMINRTISFEVTPHQNLRAGGDLLKGQEMRIWVNADQTVNLSWKPFSYGEQAWNKVFLNVGNESNILDLKSSSPLKVGKVNYVSITTDYLTQTATLYLNGEKQGEANMEGYLYLPWKSDIGHGLNASIDNFYVMTNALSAEEIRSTHAAGYPTFSPSPAIGLVGVNRIPEFSWEMLPSSNGIHTPLYKVYVGESRDALKLVGEIKGSEQYKLEEALAAQKNYFWRVDICTPEGAVKRQGEVWNFVTGRTISREVIPQPVLTQQDKWSSQWPQVERRPEHIGFKGNGHNVEQVLDPRLLEAGGYKLTLHASCGEQKPTRPMWFILKGADEQGNQVEFHREIVELNDLKDGKVDVYFNLEKDLTQAKSVSARLQLPGSGGGRCPYWVFATKLSLLNNVDLASLPNQAPKFAKNDVVLPKMPAKDNSYSYEFKSLVQDEDVNSLTFKMVEGPSWVTVQQSGRVFSYYGAPMSAIGKHRLKVEVIDKEGLKDVIFATLEVSIPGELVMPASKAVLPKDKQVRLTGSRITHFIQDDATALWNFKPAKTGVYNVYLNAGSPNENVGKVTINGVEKQFTIKNTGGYGKDRDHLVGQFKLTEGEPSQLVLGVIKRKEGLCDVNHIRIVPVNSEGE